MQKNMQIALTTYQKSFSATDLPGASLAHARRKLPSAQALQAQAHPAQARLDASRRKLSRRKTSGRRKASSASPARSRPPVTASPVPSGCSDPARRGPGVTVRSAARPAAARPAVAPRSGPGVAAPILETCFLSWTRSGFLLDRKKENRLQPVQ